MKGFDKPYTFTHSRLVLIVSYQVEMQRKLEEKDRQIADLRRQLAAKDRVMETQRAVLEEASHHFTPALRAKVTFHMFPLMFDVY